MIHRKSIEGSRAEGRAVRAFFHSTVARCALSGLALVLAILPAPARAQSADPQPVPQPSAQSADQKLDQLQQKVDQLDQAVKLPSESRNWRRRPPLRRPKRTPP